MLMTMDAISFVLSGANAVQSGYFIITTILLISGFVAGIFLYRNEEKERKQRGEEEFDYLLRNADFLVENEGTCLVGTGVGTMKGQRFNLSGQSLMIGRDKEKCNVCYPFDEKGISSVHCKIEKVNNRIILVDLNSSYGTFLKDGTRLISNIPYDLHNGDSFYLAAEKHMFTIN